MAHLPPKSSSGRTDKRSWHRIVEGADHASFWRDPETAKMSIAAILNVLDAAQNGANLKVSPT